MTSTLVDTNIFIDILGPSDTPTRSWSMQALKACLGEGRIIVSAIVWAELAEPKLGEALLFTALSWLRPKREDFPFAAAYAAGQAHRTYRRQGGTRERTLPDFLIGAHALTAGHRLLTRDGGRYRAYFPTLDLLSPETRP
ncbi:MULTISPECIES: type II toxin-antitoxin system VapC family toxin [unclassified Aureimonas]|uniref:type II toxin-antitoxin system VapC family toxin n=1 Tax=unclassified Aureimonas TaxID=2615206 RepID=UPI0006F31F46|nr:MULTISPECIES: type II toxin-antitoxin system VapC family toxin [unclassified Aureimonas]KQT55149.1 DNA-binding protein [Aureimonas sp. Leaf427]KQT70938.1 DNA-binding protein [Aureimonas sp. Leaf460]